MAAIDIILIRGKNHGFLVRRERHVFHIEIASGQQRGGAAAGRDRIQVVAAVLLGGEDDASVREVQGGVLSEAGQGIVEFVAAMPELMRRAADFVSDPERPGLRAHRNQRKFGFLSWRPNKNNLFAIRRPARHGIFIDSGGEVANRVAARIADGDETVRAALADKRDVLAIRGPLRRNGVAANCGQFFPLLLAVDGGDPQFLLGGPQGLLAIRRDLDIFAAFLRAPHFAEQTRRGILCVNIYGEYLLLGAFGPAFGIRAFLSIIELGAHCIQRGLAVRRKTQTGYRLPVVQLVMGELASGAGEVRPFGDPDITYAFRVEDPGDPVRLLGRDESGREGRSQHLLQSKLRLREYPDGGSQHPSKKQQADTFGCGHSALV